MLASDRRNSLIIQLFAPDIPARGNMAEREGFEPSIQVLTDLVADHQGFAYTASQYQHFPSPLRTAPAEHLDSRPEKALPGC